MSGVSGNKKDYSDYITHVKNLRFDHVIFVGKNKVIGRREK